MWKRIVRWVVLGVTALFLLIQLVPYGRAHTNPPVLAEPAWDSPQTRALAVRACYDCHSNETTWPWYANVAPISWRVQQDVNEGRRKVNFSEWNRTQSKATKAAATVADGEMPPWDYLLNHPLARLSSAERAELIRGLTATFGAGRGGHAPVADRVASDTPHWLTLTPVSQRR